VDVQRSGQDAAAGFVHLVEKSAIRQVIWVKICAWLCFVSCGD
jgi:hypothetical protein